MALADFAPAARPSIIGSAVHSLVQALVARRAARARQAALDDLLFMPEHRLRDLGIDPQQLHQAIDARFWPTRK